jgi:hypothetical protein
MGVLRNRHHKKMVLLMERKEAQIAHSSPETGKFILVL